MYAVFTTVTMLGKIHLVLDNKKHYLMKMDKEDVSLPRLCVVKQFVPCH